MGNVLLSVVFRPPRPSTYTEYSLYPKLFFKETRLGVEIPICVNFPSVPGWTKRSLAIDPEQPWVLFSHGNAEDLGNATVWTNYLSEECSILMISYDYSGYGLSKRKRPKNLKSNDIPDGQEEPRIEPCEDSLYADCEAVLEFAEMELGLKREKAILWGRSLGCCACCHLASATKEEGRSLAGVILQAPFTSIYEVALNTHLKTPPESDFFRNYDKVKAMDGFGAPCFVVHGTNDWIVNWWHGREMAALIKDEELWPPLFVDGGHNDLEQSCERFVHEIKEFVDYCSLRCSADG